MMINLQPCLCPKCEGLGRQVDLASTSMGTCCPACGGCGVLFPDGWNGAVKPVAPNTEEILKKLRGLVNTLEEGQLYCCSRAPERAGGIEWATDKLRNLLREVDRA